MRLGLHALAVTDHDGLYGIVRMAEAAAAAKSDVATVFGAELSLGLTGPQNGEADPEGTHLLVLARKEEGYHRLAMAITAAQLKGGEKGKPSYDLDDLAERAGGHWLILTGCRKGAVRQALDAGGSEHERHAAAPESSSTGSSRCSAPTTSWSNCSTRATRGMTTATTHSQPSLPSAGCDWSPRETCTTPPRTSTTWRPHWRPYAPAGASMTWMAGSRPPASPTSAAGRRWPRASATTRARSRTPCCWPMNSRSSSDGRSRDYRSRRCQKGTPRCRGCVNSCGRAWRARASSPPRRTSSASIASST